MGHGRDLVLPEHPAQLLLLELLAEPIGKQIRTGSLHQRPCPVQNLQYTTTQRDPVLAVRIRPPGRDSPHTLVPINLGPLDAPHLLKDVFEGRKFEDGKPVSTQQRKNAA